MDRLTTAGSVALIAVAIACGGAQSPGTATGSGAKLAARPAAVSVKAGGEVTFTIRNVGSETLRYRHPGGSSGCAAFHWGIVVSAPNGVVYSQQPPNAGPRICTTVMVPPRDIVIPVGEIGGKVTVRTGGRWWARSPDGGPTPHQPGTPLGPGEYIVRITGVPTMQIVAQITVTPAE